MTQEKKAFAADVGKVLQLVIHSIYTNKEIFIRELISNSSDACDKLRYQAQTDSTLLANDSELKISIKINKDDQTIIIRDNGIGMNKEDLNENLGTIAKSGTQNFLEQLSGNNKKDSQLIGQFGVGFYSSFMVASKVTVTSRKAGESEVCSWESNGEGEYTISDAKKDFTRGTEIILKIREEEKEFLDHFRLKHIVKTYSDHISIPIFFTNEDDTETQVNSSSAVWRRNKSEVTEEQYKEFYHSVSHATDDPWITLHNKNEGVVEYNNLLFVPSAKTFDLFHPDRKTRVKLYIKRVFIGDENIDIIPNYLRFLRGVVDSEDLPLNISRETLQNNATLAKIKSSITKKLLNELIKKKKSDVEGYHKFWENFGSVLKEGLCEHNTDHEKLLETCIFRSAVHDKMISLDEYIENSKSEDKIIYYLSGDDATKLKNSPQIEGFMKKGIDVLLFTDHVDDFWVNVNGTYKGYTVKSATRSDIDLDKVDGKKEDENKDVKDVTNKKLLDYFKDALGNLVKDVRISKKLSSTPACLAVEDGAMDIRMERFLVEQKQLNNTSAKILEINLEHKLVQKIAILYESNDTKNEAKELIQLIHDQACVIEGEPVSDVGAFTQRMNNLFNKI